MDISHITNVISSVGFQRTAHIPSEKELFEATLSLFMFQLHTLTLESWNRFAKNQKELAEDAVERHTAQRQKAAELNNQRRQIEELQEDYRLHGTHRQAGKFRFHQGSSSEHRHLHLAV